MFKGFAWSNVWPSSLQHTRWRGTPPHSWVRAHSATALTNDELRVLHNVSRPSLQRHVHQLSGRRRRECPEVWGPAQVLVKVSTADHSHDSVTTSEVRIESLRGTLCSRRYSAAS